MNVRRVLTALIGLGVAAFVAVTASNIFETQSLSPSELQDKPAKKEVYSVSKGTSRFVDERSWPKGTTNVGDETIWCSHADRASDPRCAQMRKAELDNRGLVSSFTRSEAADKKGWTGLSVPRDWFQYPLLQASQGELDRNIAVNRENEMNSDWTQYPYDVASYADGDGLFSNHENANDKATADPDTQEEPIGVDRYSYFWRVENPMGYPSEDLPARRTYPFDLSIGGKSYESFWGGKDGISKSIEGRNGWFHDAAQPASLGDNDRADYDSYWAQRAAEPSTPEEARERDGFWRADADMGNGLAAAADPDLADGDDGLLRPFRARYDDSRAYDSPAWQARGELPAGGAGTALPGDWPAPLYQYAVDGTEHDLRRAVTDPVAGDVADPLEPTAVEYDDADRGHVLDLPDDSDGPGGGGGGGSWAAEVLPDGSAPRPASERYVVDGPEDAIACPSGGPCLFA